MIMVEYIKTVDSPKYDAMYLEPLAEMFLDMHNTHAEKVPELYKPCTIQDIKDNIKSEDNIYKPFIAMENNEILGYIAFAEIHKEETKMFPEFHYINIGGIYVKPAHRDKGVASYMIQYVEMCAMNQNIKNVTASICFFNEVSSCLFTKNGYDGKNYRVIKRLK